jgi:hypothetical protein
MLLLPHLTFILLSLDVHISDYIWDDSITEVQNTFEHWNPHRICLRYRKLMFDTVVLLVISISDLIYRSFPKYHNRCNSAMFANVADIMQDDDADRPYKAFASFQFILFALYSVFGVTLSVTPPLIRGLPWPHRWPI